MQPRLSWHAEHTPRLFQLMVPVLTATALCCYTPFPEQRTLPPAMVFLPATYALLHIRPFRLHGAGSTEQTAAIATTILAHTGTHTAAGAKSSLPRRHQQTWIPPAVHLRTTSPDIAGRPFLRACLQHLTAAAHARYARHLSTLRGTCTACRRITSTPVTYCTRRNVDSVLRFLRA